MTDPNAAPAASARLTTHVLDLTSGQPARGMGIALARLDGAGSTVLVDTVTNDDGRTDAPLLVDGHLTPGRYELAFSVGAYFADGGHPSSTAYLDVVPVRFGVAAGVGHLHVALLVTPWSYTTYRGS